MLRFYILCISLLTNLIIGFHCYAEKIINDAEINNVIQEIASPVLKASKLPNVEIILIESNQINAYASFDNKIFLYSGLVKQADPDMLRGVISHELGHIMSKHISKSLVLHNKLSKLSTLSILGLTAATILTQSPDLLSGTLPVVLDYAHKSATKFSRSQELAADNIATSLLEKSSHSAIGMVNFFNQLKSSSAQNTDIYNSTHPPYSERLQLIKNFMLNSKYKNNNPESQIYQKYKRAVMKLEFLTEDPKIVLAKYHQKSYSTDLKQYAESISLLLQAKYDSALEKILSLSKKFPQDPYYLELIGDILFLKGDLASINFYNQALALLKNDKNIRLSRDISAISLYENNLIPKKYYLDLLSMSYSKDSDPIIFYFLSVYHNKSGNKTKGAVMAAIFCNRIGDVTRAKALSKSVISELIPQTPDWYKIQEILSQ